MRNITKGEKYGVLDHGHVIYVDHMGSDMDIVDAARVSYNGEGKSSDRTLLRYLMRHRHTSPFEMCELKVIIKCPIFVARQLVRHRTASMNEVSGRYTELPNEQYFPATFRRQSASNKQGSEGEIGGAASFQIDMLWRKARDAANEVYRRALGAGVAKEIARCPLPLTQYTEFVWKIDLHNLMHFLELRLDEHAQYEIRVYAEALKEIAVRLFPEAMRAFFDYRRDGCTLSRMERNIVAHALVDYFTPDMLAELRKAYTTHMMSEREFDEFVTKLHLDDIMKGSKERTQ